jgi:hypothetical protein
MHTGLTRKPPALDSLQVRVIPSENPVHAINKVLLFAEAMRLSWVDREFAFDTVILQCLKQLLALADRIIRVFGAMQDQSRGPGILNVGNRRDSLKQFKILVRRSEEVDITGGVIFSAQLA